MTKKQILSPTSTNLLNNLFRTPKTCPNASFESFCSSLLNDNTEQGNENKEKSENIVWCHEYSREILASLKESEKRRRKFDFKSRQAMHRPILLMLMEIAADRLSLSRTTLHLGVFLLDGFMDTFTISVVKLNASALMCLLIAAKIEESDLNIPQFEQLNDLVGGVYTKNEFKTVEKKIIATYEFDFLYPTAASFVEIYSNQIVSFQDFLCYRIHRASTHSSVFSTYESMLKECTDVLFDVLNACLHDNRLVNLTPSVVGAACLAATRCIQNIQPVWTERFLQLTGYNYEQIEPFVEVIILMYKSNYSKQSNTKICDSPDSGICSDFKSEPDSEEDDVDVVDYYPAVKRRRILS